MAGLSNLKNNHFLKKKMKLGMNKINEKFEIIDMSLISWIIKLNEYWTKNIQTIKWKDEFQFIHLFSLNNNFFWRENIMSKWNIDG